MLGVVPIKKNVTLYDLQVMYEQKLLALFFYIHFLILL